MTSSPAVVGMGGSLPGTNASYEWDRFDSEAYRARNYAETRHDLPIVQQVRDYFGSDEVQDYFAGLGRDPVAIDVGTGPNLYPALALVPFVGSMCLYEFSGANVAWLAAQKAAGWPTWDEGLKAFWDVYLEHPLYAKAGEDPRRIMTERLRIRQGSVFDLEPAADRAYDAATMFFVAESLSQDEDEFARAVGCFLGVLRSGAPFVAAFMEGSLGYTVEGVEFPATSVGWPEIETVLGRGGATGVRLLRRVDADPGLRHGYTGMIVAAGRKA